MKKASLYCIALTVISLYPGLNAQSGATLPLIPFHLRFEKYIQNPSDGAYTFQFKFADLPAPHVKWPDAPESKSEFKIGDVIGRYKIVRFSQRIEKPGPNDDFVSRDVSELTFENLAKPNENISVRFRQEYNLPEAGMPTPGIEAALSRYKVGDEEAPLLKELNLASQPRFDYPNEPAGESMTIYYLPEGSLTVSTRLTEDRKVVLSYVPLFVEDHTPVADRLKKADQSMDDNVKQLKSK